MLRAKPDDAPWERRMYAAAPRTEPRPAPERLARARGRAEVSFRRRGAADVLTDLYQSGCLRVRFPRVAAGAPPEAVFLNTAGGLTDGDDLCFSVEVAAGASAIATSQAAERIYRSRGAASRIETGLAVADGASLFWLPQETILFDGARLRRRLGVTLEGSARLLACEALVFGRHGHGEVVRRGLVHDAWRIARDRRLVWCDAFALSGDMDAALARPAVAGGRRAHATLVYAGCDAGAWLGPAREALGGIAGRGAATLVGEVLLVRLLAEDAMDLRRDLARVAGALYAGLTGRPAAMPSVWAC